MQHKRLIAVMTCHKDAYRAKAQAQRQTWVEPIKQFADVVFFAGRGTTSFETVSLDADDSYSGLPEKVQAIMKWGTEHGYDFITKIDDDCYVVPQRWPYLPLKGYDYVGFFREPFGSYPAHFPYGFCYHLNWAAARLVANHKWNGDWVDERFVANVLAYYGISGSHDAKNYRVTGPHLNAEVVAGHPTLKLGTVFCEYGPQQIKNLHAAFIDAPAITEILAPPLPRVPLCKITKEQLNARPQDRIPEEKL